MTQDMERRLARLGRKGWVLEIDMPHGAHEHRVVLIKREIVIAGPHPNGRWNARDNAMRAAIEGAENMDEPKRARKAKR